MRLLVLGGTRSGKSAYAETCAARTGAPVVYVATAQVDPDDAEMAARIEIHRDRRPEQWVTVENSDLPQVFRTYPEHTILIDDLGGWLTSRLDRTLEWTRDSPETNRDIDELVEAVAHHQHSVVMVSPEVGLGVVPVTVSARVFIDLIGKVNQHLAQVCDRTDLVIAGQVLPLAAPAKKESTTTSGPQSAAVAVPVAATAAVAAADSPSEGHAATADAEADAPESPAGTADGPADLSLSEQSGPGDAPTSNATTVQGQSEDFPGLRDVEFYDDPVVFESVKPPSHEAAKRARDRQLELTKPPGSLGRLEEIGEWICACQDQCPPAPIERARVVVFAGDHGVATNGVSAYPQEVTPQMVGNIVAGGAAVSVLARNAGATVRVADIAVAQSSEQQAADHKVCQSSGSIDREDALSSQQVKAAIAAGRRIADEEIDEGADLLIAGDLGIGNTTPATVLACLFTGKEPVALVGRGTGVDDQGWIRKTAAIRDAAYRGRNDVRDPETLLRRVAGADFAAMAGFLAQAALRRTPVVLDGSVVTAAALVAETMAPGARQWWRAGHRSAEPAHTETLKYLALEPLVEYQMRLGEGSGAVTALPVVHAAVAILRDMATFADAGVSDKQ